MESTSVFLLAWHLLSSHTESSYSVENPSHVLCTRHSSHITEEANICLGTGPHLKMKTTIKVKMRPKQVNPIPHDDFSAFREDDYFSLLGLLS